MADTGTPVNTPSTPSGTLPEEEWDTPSQVAALRREASSLPQTLDPIFTHNDAFVRCFLRARKGDVPAAARMLLRHQEHCVSHSQQYGWPHSFATLRGLCQSELETGKAYVRGRDKGGRPLVIIRADKHLAGGSKEAMERLVTYVISSVVALLHRDDLKDEVTGAPLPPVHTFTAVLDFSSFGMANMDVEVAKLIVTTLSNHYPEHLCQMLMVNSGWVAWSLWQIVRLLLDARTERKIVFLNSTDLPAHIDPVHIPVWVGGQDKYEFKPSDTEGWEITKAGPCNPWLRPIPATSMFADGKTAPPGAGAGGAAAGGAQ